MSQVKESNRPNSSQTDSDKFNSAFLLLGISNFLSREAKKLSKKFPEIISQFPGSIIYDQPPTNLGVGTQFGIHLGPSTCWAGKSHKQQFRTGCSKWGGGFRFMQDVHHLNYLNGSQTRCICNGYSQVARCVFARLFRGGFVWAGWASFKSFKWKCVSILVY